MPRRTICSSTAYCSANPARSALNLFARRPGAWWMNVKDLLLCEARALCVESVRAATRGLVMNGNRLSTQGPQRSSRRRRIVHFDRCLSANTARSALNLFAPRRGRLVMNGKRLSTQGPQRSSRRRRIVHFDRCLSANTARSALNLFAPRRGRLVMNGKRLSTQGPQRSPRRTIGFDGLCSTNPARSALNLFSLR